MALLVKCPGCGHIGDDEVPHRVKNTDVLEGIDPDRTSLLGFECGQCGLHFPAFSWKMAFTAEGRLDLAMNLIDEGTGAPYDLDSEPWWVQDKGPYGNRCGPVKLH